jgi:probable rRNA maturation factor
MVEINNTTKRKINVVRIKKITKTFFNNFNIKKDRTVSLAFIEDDKMRQINAAYRGKNSPTDVLCFEDLDEIIINLDQIKRQSKEEGRKMSDEIEFIFVHGLLHLAGYRDDTEKGRLEMINLAEDFLLNLK